MFGTEDDIVSIFGDVNIPCKTIEKHGQTSVCSSNVVACLAFEPITFSVKEKVETHGGSFGPMVVSVH